VEVLKLMLCAMSIFADPSTQNGIAIDVDNLRMLG
jgi:hypothetical protein